MIHYHDTSSSQAEPIIQKRGEHYLVFFLRICIHSIILTLSLTRIIVIHRIQDKEPRALVFHTNILLIKAKIQLIRNKVFFLVVKLLVFLLKV